jgi:phage terminase small subunit
MNTPDTDAQPMRIASKPLTPKQLAFVDEYMRNGRNGTKAAIAAGYSENRAPFTASRLVSNGNVADEIKRRVEAYSKTAGLEVVVILEEAKKIAFSDIAAAFDESGALLPVHKMSATARGAIASIKVVEMTPVAQVDANGNIESTPMYTKEVKLWDKPAAIFKLLEFIKGVPPPSGPTTQVNVQINQVFDWNKIRSQRGKVIGS